MTVTAQSAADLVLDGKGILAADESGPTMDARLRSAGAWPGAETRRAYREMLVTTPGLSLGIRVDAGARPLAGAPGETVTEGLDGLRARLAGYAARGARFASWRAVLRIGDGRPSWRALRANAYALARYALLGQEEGVVPMIEVLIEGPHGPARGREVTSAVLMVTVTELQDMGVPLEGVVLKPSMVLPDADGRGLAAPQIVAQQTLAALWCAVPEEAAAVAFPSGGQSPARATANLAALRRLSPPWPVTFSFGWALAEPALAAWHGDPACIAAGQRALANRVACNVAALQGAYTAVLEPSYVLRGRDARTVSGPGAQGSSSTGSPSAIGPGATIEP